MVTITIDEGKRAYQPGEIISGKLTWQLPEPADSAELRLFWFTQGKGDEDVEIVERMQAQPAQRGELSFRFTLPGSPYSFSGKLISLTWAIEGIIGDEHYREEFVLSPTGREIVIAKAGGDEGAP